MTKYQEEIKELRAEIHQKQKKILELQQKEKALLSGLTENMPLPAKGKKNKEGIVMQQVAWTPRENVKLLQGYGYVGTVRANVGMLYL